MKMKINPAGDPVNLDREHFSGGGKMKLVYVSGVEGNSVYLNDIRIAGPKPWGGGKIIKSLNVEEKNILYAMKKISYEKWLEPSHEEKG